MAFIALLWRAYLNLLALLGHTLLVVAAFALCAFTLIDQFHALDDTARNAGLFLFGFAVMAFSTLRRWIWMLVGLTVPWATVVLGSVVLLTDDHYRFTITPLLVALAVVPPIFVLVVLELLPKPEVTRGSVDPSS